MAKHPKKQQFIGRDMHKKDVNSGFGELPRDCTVKNRQSTQSATSQSAQDDTAEDAENRLAAPGHEERDIGNIVSGYAFEIIIAVILFFIVISSAFSYELVRPLLEQRTEQESVLVNFFRPNEDIKKFKHTNQAR